MIILLGTNDLKMRFSVSAYDIAKGAGALVQTVQKSEVAGLQIVMGLFAPNVAESCRSGGEYVARVVFRSDPWYPKTVDQARLSTQSGRD